MSVALVTCVEVIYIWRSVTMAAGVGVRSLDECSSGDVYGR